jgi:deaminated glutathione amidase
VEAGQRLSVVLVQRASSLDPAANLAALASVVPDVMPADVVVFPEAFARDYGKAGSDLAPYAEDADGPFGTAVRSLAGEHGTVVVAGMFERSGDPARPWHTVLLADGVRRTVYRKIHLYDSFGHRESDVLSAGPLEPAVTEVGGWRMGLMTCYDLRFPELARALVDAGAEALLVPSAWVAGPRKVDHWRTLVTARAVENTVYVVAVDQPGPRYTGHTMVVAPTGDVLVEAGTEPDVLSAVLERDVLDEAREQNPSLRNRRM